MFRSVRRNGFPYYIFDELQAVPNFVHAFTGRDTDAAIIDCPNPAQVASDKREFMTALGLNEVVQLRQTHSCRVLEANHIGSETQGDGIIVCRPNIYAIVKTADCMPLMIISAQRQQLALIHAGWRGTLQRIVERGAKQFLERTGQRATELTAALGPCIRSCCYQVGPEVVEAFRRAGHPSDVFRGDCLDLASASRSQLQNVGITRIFDCRICTSCRSDQFYSWRRCRDRGRMWALAGFGDSL